MDSGMLVWMVSVRPDTPVYPPSDGPPAGDGQNPVGVSRFPASNVFVVLVNAANGNFVEATQTYSPSAG